MLNFTTHLTLRSSTIFFNHDNSCDIYCYLRIMNSRLLNLATISAMSAASILAADHRPNIVLFMVDDMGWQDTSVPFHSETTPLNSRYRTPNMERLAAMGTKFTSAYACAISSPSRCSLMTGMNQARHRVTNWTLHRDRPTDDPTAGYQLPDWNYNGIQPTDSINNSVHCTPLPELLRRAGYHTIHVGKAHFGAFDTPAADPLNMGFDVNIAGTAAGGPADGAYLGKNRFGHNPDGSPVSSYAIPHLNKYWDEDIFLTEALTREAIAAADSVRRDGRSFYLYLSHYAVHVPFRADNRFTDHYTDLDIPEQQYATLIEGMDKSLGDVIDYIESTGLADNTIIIFMSDNGGLDFYARGQMPEQAGDRHNYPLRSGKGSAYEGGVREPMIVSWPGVTAPGSSTASPVIIEDFFPTLLDMAQATDRSTIQTVDGRSFVDILRNPASPQPLRSLIWNTPNNWTNMIDDDTKKRLGIGPTAAIRLGDYKLIYRYDDRSHELYNTAVDIGETTDLADRMPLLTAELSRMLASELRRMDAQRPSAIEPDGTLIPLPWPDE